MYTYHRFGNRLMGSWLSSSADTYNRVVRYERVRPALLWDYVLQTKSLEDKYPGRSAYHCAASKDDRMHDTKSNTKSRHRMQDENVRTTKVSSDGREHQVGAIKGKSFLRPGFGSFHFLEYIL